MHEKMKTFQNYNSACYEAQTQLNADTEEDIQITENLMQVQPIELKNIKIISDLTQEIQNRQIQIENCRKEGTKVMNLFEEKRSLIFKLKSMQ